MIKVKITGHSGKQKGDITSFRVLARCPHCENETDVTKSELSMESVQCEHCCYEFDINLDNE